MELKDQVCSLELAKRLKELGVKQKGLFSWARQGGFKNWGLELYPPKPQLKRIGRDYYVAFTSSELFNILPSVKCYEPQLVRGYLFGDTQLKYCCRYDGTESDNSPFVDINPCNALAKMLVYLIENELMEIPNE